MGCFVYIFASLRALWKEFFCISLVTVISVKQLFMTWSRVACIVSEYMELNKTWTPMAAFLFVLCVCACTFCSWIFIQPSWQFLIFLILSPFWHHSPRNDCFMQVQNRQSNNCPSFHPSLRQIQAFFAFQVSKIAVVKISHIVVCLSHLHFTFFFVFWFTVVADVVMHVFVLERCVVRPKKSLFLCFACVVWTIKFCEKCSDGCVILTSLRCSWSLMVGSLGLWYPVCCDVWGGGEIYVQQICQLTRTKHCLSRPRHS